MSDRIVIYDSFFGNTKLVAEAIGEALEDATVKKVSEVSKNDLKGVNILIIGSPTRAFQASPDIKRFLSNLKPGELDGIRAAAFDTRIPQDQIGSGFLRFMINIFGYADKKITKQLLKAGATIAIDSEGFGVKDTEGPLLEGELERARAWAKQIL
jgi:flavodoxin